MGRDLALTAPDDLQARIDALEAELRALRYAARARDDARFLGTIYGVVTRNEFSTIELLEHTHHDSDLRAVLEGMTRRTLGARLKRLAGHDVAGQVLTKITRDQHGCIWQFLSQEPACLSPVAGA